MGSNPKSSLSPGQIAQKVYDETNDRIRVDAEVNTQLHGDLEVSITDQEDSIQIGDGTDRLAINADGSINVAVTSSVLPTGAATETTLSSVLANQTNGTQQTLIVDTEGHTLKIVKENDNYNSSLHGIPIYGVDDSNPTKKYRPFITDDQGHLYTHSLDTSDTKINPATSEKQDVGNTSLSSIDGKLTDDYGASSGAVRTAAQIGNTTGAADFNSGTSSAQTLRTAANNYGIVQTSAPTAGTNATVKQTTVDSYGRIATSGAPAINTEWGQMFQTSTNSQALTGTTETAFFYFQNPNGSGKTAKIYNIEFGPTLGNNYVTYRIYLNPTVTANGTGLTETGNRQTNQASTVVNTFLIPTVSSNGTLLKTIVNSGLSGSTREVLYNFGFWIEANNSLLITRTLSANATIGGVNIMWAEQ